MPEQVVERQAERRDLVGADTARGLMITALGEFVLPHGGSAWTQTLIDTLDLFDVRPKATRQVLARLADQGWLDRTRDGRRTRWHLTDASRAVLGDGAARIYGFGRDRAAWDGRWLLLMVSLSERDEHRRYRLTTGLNWAGFGSLGQGIWVSPWIDQEQAAVGVLADLGIEHATSFVAEVGHLGSGTDIAARAWELDDLRSRYDEFLHTTGGGPRTPTGGTAASALIGLVHRWRRFPSIDPELPPELLADDWPARFAVERFAARRESLLDAARDWWANTDDGYGRHEPAVTGSVSGPARVAAG